MTSGGADHQPRSINFACHYEDNENMHSSRHRPNHWRDLAAVGQSLSHLSLETTSRYSSRLYTHG